MKLLLEFDDFNPKRDVNCLSTIQYLVRVFPNIKITLFTSPLYERNPLFSDQQWCRDVLQLIQSDNIRLAVHGLYHTTTEFKHKTYNDASISILLAESIFNHSGLPFIKVFRGPQWGMNNYTIEALIKANYTHIYNHEDSKWLELDFINKIKFVYYKWTLKDNLPENLTTINDVVVAHGHTHNVCNNGIIESVQKIEDCINNYNPTFLFANEY